MTPAYNEKTAAWIDYACYDKDGAANTPGTLAYQIDCLTTGAVIRASTAMVAAQSGEIELTPADTTLQSQDNEYELRVITVTADADEDTQHIETYQYGVRNLVAIT